jgi:hypothetical protein
MLQIMLQENSYEHHDTRHLCFFFFMSSRKSRPHSELSHIRPARGGERIISRAFSESTYLVSNS